MMPSECSCRFLKNQQFLQQLHHQERGKQTTPDFTAVERSHRRLWRQNDIRQPSGFETADSAVPLQQIVVEVLPQHVHLLIRESAHPEPRGVFPAAGDHLRLRGNSRWTSAEMLCDHNSIDQSFEWQQTPLNRARTISVKIKGIGLLRIIYAVYIYTQTYSVYGKRSVVQR